MESYYFNLIPQHNDIKYHLSDLLDIVYLKTIAPPKKDEENYKCAKKLSSLGTNNVYEFLENIQNIKSPNLTDASEILTKRY